MSNPFAAPMRMTVDPASLHEHTRNYKKHSKTQLDRIARSLSTFGQGRSVVTWHNTIIAGHGVVAAARALGWNTIQVDELDPAMPEAVALAYLVADNELSRLADPDQEALTALLQEAQAFDATLLDAMGYDQKELDELLASVTPVGTDDADSTPQLGGLEFRIIILCTDETQQAELLERFEEEGLDCQALIS